MTKKIRLQVYDKFNGRCAYCGRLIEITDMQVDHIVPEKQWGTDFISNLNPSCRRCNHYKRAHTLETFRDMIKTLHERVRDIYICKVAEDYGIIKIEPWDGLFFFERVKK